MLRLCFQSAFFAVPDALEPCHYFFGSIGVSVLAVYDWLCGILHTATQAFVVESFVTLSDFSQALPEPAATLKEVLAGKILGDFMVMNLLIGYPFEIPLKLNKYGSGTRSGFCKVFLRN